MALSPRDIPSIDILLGRPDAEALIERWGRAPAVSALREAAAGARRELATGEGDATTCDDASELAGRIVARAARHLSAALRPSLRRVINATGVIVHTNLGRAPLAEAAIAHLAAVARGYVNLEYDLEQGVRGRRDTHAEALLCRLTGAEAAIVVNNNAAATLLVLAAIAAGREVLISRAELVEIGGGFRVPDIMRQSGADLREVGTTNRTRVADFAAAIGERTGLILRVHPSNFRIEGFTEAPDAAALVALARRFAVPIVEDLGSGNVLGPRLGRADTGGAAGGVEEPTVDDSLRTGYDAVCVSGDKLLGGPQAGLILGRADLVNRMRRHPLMRAFRVDKLTYAALEATLLEHLAGRAAATVPVARMIAADRDAVAVRAAMLAERLRSVDGLTAALADGVSTIGGGSAPGSALPTVLVALRTATGAGALLSRLRGQSPPVVARIEDDRVVLDLRTVRADEDEELATLIAGAAEEIQRS